MIAAIQRRMAARSDEERQGGFTLIELMVVVMIIAILVGIAIPAFLGARKRAQDTASKSNLRNALSTAQTIFTDTQAFLASSGATPGPMQAALGSEEPSLIFKAAETDLSAAPKEISVKTRTSAVSGATGLDEIVLASKSASGKCFYLRHVNTAGSTTLSGSYTANSTTLDCSADVGDTSAALTWTAL